MGVGGESEEVAPPLPLPFSHHSFVSIGVVQSFLHFLACSAQCSDCLHNRSMLFFIRFLSVAGAVPCHR